MNLHEYRDMKIFLFFSTLLISVYASAGPFGLSKGMSLDEVKKKGPFVITEVQYIYKSKTTAEGHPDIESYILTITPDHGLCKIIAISKTINTSQYGEELRSKYDDIIFSLLKKYGEPNDKFDLLKDGSIWNESRDWMMSLIKEERVLFTYWSKTSGKLRSTNLSDSIKSIAVEAGAYSNTKGYYKLIYDFDNIGNCVATIKSKRDANL